MTRTERKRLRRLIRLAMQGPEVHRMLAPIQCLCCGRSMDTVPQRLWHRLVCWRKHPMQATKRGRIEDE